VEAREGGEDGGEGVEAIVEEGEEVEEVVEAAEAGMAVVVAVVVAVFVFLNLHLLFSRALHSVFCLPFPQPFSVGLSRHFFLSYSDVACRACCALE
jgi:hypothetical protein